MILRDPGGSDVARVVLLVPGGLPLLGGGGAGGWLAALMGCAFPLGSRQRLRSSAGESRQGLLPGCTASSATVVLRALLLDPEALVEAPVKV